MTATYCTAAQVGEAMGLAWANEDTLGSNALTNSIHVATSVGRKYATGDLVRLYNSNGSSDDVTVTGVSYGTSLITIAVGSIGSASWFTTAKSASVQLKSYFSGKSNPTKSVVEDWINNAEAEIDSYTRDSWGSLGQFSGYLKWDPRRFMILGEPYSYYRVKLPYSDPVTPLASASGDSLKVWNGSTETELVGTYTEGRTNDFWFDGKYYLYINAIRPWPENNSIYISYRYGYKSVPNDIRRACLLLTMQQFNDANRYNNSGLTEGYQGETTPYTQSSMSYRNMAYTLLKKRRGLIFG